jgi:isocitrate dehydrogenase kinase/phosphatase
VDLALQQNAAKGVSGNSSRIMQIPGLTDGWTELKDKFLTEKDAFKTLILEKHQAKKEEYRVWRDTVKRATNEKDQLAHRRILEFEKHKKHLVCRVHGGSSLPSDEVPAAKVRPRSV